MARLNWSPVVSSLLKKFQDHNVEILGVNDGESNLGIPQEQSKLGIRKWATSIIASVDTSAVLIRKNGTTAMLYIVLGNGAHEILADYGVKSNSKLLEIIEKVEEDFYTQWENKKVPVTQ